MAALRPIGVASSPPSTGGARRGDDSAHSECRLPLREHAFTERDFSFLRRIAYDETGITFAENKQDLVYNRLSRRVRQLRLECFADYCLLLQQDDNDELHHFINALTTNTTSFFREMHHFDHVAHHLANRRSLRIWSAGCSTGQEPYSLAMILAAAGQHHRDDHPPILATDLDSNVLATAEAGIYPIDLADQIPQPMLKSFWLRGHGNNSGTMRLGDAVRERVAFRKLNLIQQWPMKHKFDAIFCRNVAIYFDLATRRRLFDRFADQLLPHGLLYIGHSESMHDVSRRFESLGHTIYRKIS